MIVFADAHGLGKFEAYGALRSCARNMAYGCKRGQVQLGNAHGDIGPGRNRFHDLDGAPVFAQVHAAPAAVVLLSAIVSPAESDGAGEGGARPLASLRFQDVAAVGHWVK